MSILLDPKDIEIRVFKILQSFFFQCKFSTTTPRSSNDKIYELRTYYIHPEHVKKFLELSKEHLHIRFQHSKCLGYWTGELGAGINDMVHIWEYGRFSPLIYRTND